MNKQEVLNAVRALGATGQLTDVEVIAALRGAQPATGASAAVSAEPAFRRSISISKALYFIGGAVILIGLIILIVQNWKEMGSAIQLLVTLGIAVATFVTGLLLRDREGLGVAAKVFSGIAGIMFPIGVGVLLNLMGIAFDTPSVHMFVAAGLLVVFGVTLTLLRDPIHAFFSVLYGTWFYAAAVAFLMKDAGLLYMEHFVQYAIMLLGVAYLFISHALRSSNEFYYRRLSALLTGLGLIAILGAAISMGGLWDGIFPFLVFAVMFASVYLHNGIYLKLGSIFLMGYLLKISAQYFSDSFGWPLALVFAGLALMGVGYLTFYLNRKYIKTSPSA